MHSSIIFRKGNKLSFFISLMFHIMGGITTNEYLHIHHMEKKRYMEHHLQPPGLVENVFPNRYYGIA
jgi:hypothetical protein